MDIDNVDTQYVTVTSSVGALAGDGPNAFTNLLAEPVQFPRGVGVQVALFKLTYQMKAGNQGSYFVSCDVVRPNQRVGDQLTNTLMEVVLLDSAVTGHTVQQFVPQRLQFVDASLINGTVNSIATMISETSSVTGDPTTDLDGTTTLTLAFRPVL